MGLRDMRPSAHDRASRDDGVSGHVSVIGHLSLVSDDCGLAHFRVTRHVGPVADLRPTSDLGPLGHG